MRYALYALFLCGTLLSSAACEPQHKKCLVDADCLAGTYCKAPMGLCLSDCTRDEQCPQDHRCDTNTGKCVPGGNNCVPKVKQSCRDGHMFWLDSCDKQGEKALDCGTLGCTAQGCTQKSATCGDQRCDAPAEDCATCPADCACPQGLTCNQTTASCQEGKEPCGDGTCAAAQGENCLSCERDCKCKGQDRCDTNSGQCIPPSNACGNGTCDKDKGEDCSSCAQDCKCSSKQVCKNGACVDPPSCGNGNCEAAKGEDCASCPNDCQCGANKKCINGQCQEDTGCNSNGTCEAQRGENCTTCAADCKCKANETCTNDKCIAKDPCGDGTCATAQGENCQTCAKDCKCKSTETCKNGACEAKSACGNGFCDGAAPHNENCTTCPTDCKCKSGQQCNNGSCVASCGNGTCEASKGETCSTCPKDCTCKSGEACDATSGTCKQQCPTGTSSIWRCKAGTNTRHRCGVLTSYKYVAETCQYGCKTGTFYDSCCTCKPKAKRCSGKDNDELQECQSDCTTWKTVETCGGTNQNNFCGVASLKCVCYTFNQCPNVADYRCKGNERQFCNVDSKGCKYWKKSALPCTGNTPLCINGDCCACKPGTKRCNGDKLEECKADCKGYKVLKDCSPTLCCNLQCGCVD